ncbi:MAG: IS607 family transposase [Microcystis sp. M54BS1]|nr:IS607 family transposase [Microcystis sp. M54BS1]MCA6599046.1 IS607 family transposase [Pseudanabaena sp. M57BS1SP1A06MG]
MNKFITIYEASKLLGVSPQTLRRWEREGKELPVQRTSGGQRRYDASKLMRPPKIENDNKLSTLAYARVSSHDQKEDLQRQEKMLELFCASHGWSFEVISDLGSGMNYHKRGLKKLIQKILNEDIGRLVLTHKDRLLRFGAELVFAICEMKNVEVVLINQGNEASFEEELAADVLEIITVFSARLYGSRSRKNKKLIENLAQAVRHADDHKSH